MIETFRLIIWLVCEVVALSLLFLLIFKAVSYLVDYPNLKSPGQGSTDFYRKNTTALQRAGWTLSYYLKRLKGGDTMNQPRYDDAHLGGLEQRINIIGVGSDDFENKIEELNEKHNVELTPDDDEFLDYI